MIDIFTAYIVQFCGYYDSFWLLITFILLFVADESPDAAERACASLAVEDLKNIKKLPEYATEIVSK